MAPLTNSQKIFGATTLVLVLSIATLGIWRVGLADQADKEAREVADVIGQAPDPVDPNPPLDVDDGSRISLGDRDAAVLTTIACIRAAGYEATLVPGQGMRPSRYVPGNPPEGVTHEELNEVVGACRSRYLDPVTTAWYEQEGHPTAEEVDALQQRLLECVQGGGVPGASHDEIANMIVNYKNPAPWQLNIAREDLWTYLECGYVEEIATGLLPPEPWPDFSVSDLVNTPRP